MGARANLIYVAAASLSVGFVGAEAVSQTHFAKAPYSNPELFRAEPLSAFEQALLARDRKKGTAQENQVRETEGDNSRGVALGRGDAAIVGLSVTGRKYGVSLDGTGTVLIKNYRFLERRSNDPFGSGLILGQKTKTTGETWLSNAWIDLKEAGPNPDYSRANNEAVTVERGNAPLNIRRTVMIGAQESGLDNKGDVRIDASFIASGHRPMRIWNGASVVIANSTVLAFPGFKGVWFGGGQGVARLDYYNCRFGHVGDRADQLSSSLPDWMVAKDEDDPVTPRVRKLERDPFDRGPDSFWVPASTPVPTGYLKGANS
ncbi:MAG TPA: hypothetical protein VG942_08295 [Hyphomonadaceae bacterium]|nr:hypothetical protein [Hyphomonadaceae bacterium]